MAMLMVFEMTLDDTMILPLMLACVVSYTMGCAACRCPALYSMGGKRRGRAQGPRQARVERAARARPDSSRVGPVVTN